MKRKFVYLALAALAFGIITSPKTTAEPKAHLQHDVVFLYGYASSEFVHSTSSSNAPVLQPYDWTNRTGITISDATAQLLDEGFSQVNYAMSGDYGSFTIQFIRRR